MIIQFAHRKYLGEAVYDPETGEYNWSYDGDDENIIELLKLLDNGQHFSKMVNREVVSDDLDPVVSNENYELGDWEYQMKKLAEYLDRTNAEVKYIDLS